MRKLYKLQGNFSEKEFRFIKNLINKKQLNKHQFIRQLLTDSVAFSGKRPAELNKDNLNYTMLAIGRVYKNNYSLVKKNPYKLKLLNNLFFQLFSEIFKIFNNPNYGNESLIQKRVAVFGSHQKRGRPKNAKKGPGRTKS